MARAFAKIAFTSVLRNVQDQQGSEKSYAKFLAPEAEAGDSLSAVESEFISLP